ncbi:hypothetical protein [Aliiroseovarius crassostreae]|uniref:hypothetical protein n=1 Tax=Aliiroseovarius crassostreae TaxID=154981 RepID=UPI00128FA4D3|nr:hypothetical protein [Aliiroseovarius crassostreae]
MKYVSSVTEPLNPRLDPGQIIALNLNNLHAWVAPPFPFQHHLLTFGCSNRTSAGQRRARTTKSPDNRKPDNRGRDGMIPFDLPSFDQFAASLLTLALIRELLFLLHRPPPHDPRKQ